MIPLKDMHAEWSECGRDVLTAMDSVIARQRFVHGPEVPAFERRWAGWVGAEHCAGVASGTAALELALRAMGVKRGDHVVVPALGFVAALEAIRNVGAVPVFCDVSRDTNIEPIFAAAAVQESGAKAVIAVCMHGKPADFPGLRRHVVDRYNVPVLIDAAQAHGATWRSGDRILPVGAAGVCTWSFYPGKALGALGDAGAVTADDPDLIQRVRQFADHGRGGTLGHGGNYRMDEIHAAALSAKLEYLPGWVERNREIAAEYHSLLERRWEADGTVAGHTYHHFEVRVPQRDEVLHWLRENGHVEVGVHYPYTLPEIAGVSGFDVAAQIASTTLSLPMVRGMEAEVVDRLNAALEVAGAAG